jgi:hypothetical protein
MQEDDIANIMAEFEWADIPGIALRTGPSMYQVHFLKYQKNLLSKLCINLQQITRKF